MASTRLRTAAVIATVLGATVAVSAPRAGVVSAGLVRTGLDARLVRVLEQRFAPAVVTDWSRVTGLIVAGGAPARADEALRLAALHPHLHIVLSGPSDAELAAVARDRAIDPARITIDRQPQNTWQNAMMSKALVAPQSGERWLLVTSSSHMPRAMGSFFAAGFPVEAWPVADGEAGNASHVAVHEWLGLLAYWLRGRSIALFPGESQT